MAFLFIIPFWFIGSNPKSLSISEEKSHSYYYSNLWKDFPLLFLSTKGTLPLNLKAFSNHYQKKDYNIL